MKTLTSKNSTSTNRMKAELTNEKKLITAFCTMNIQAFEELLAEDLKCGDANKYELMARVERQFEKLKAHGNTELIPVAGWCLGCKEKACGYRFVGNKTGHKITYVIMDIEEGRFDIANCIYFQVPGEPMPDPF